MGARDDLSPKRFSELDEKERHQRRLGWFLSEAARQAANRRMMAMCERAYDSDVLDPQKKKEVEDRGQTHQNHNEIAPICDWLIGTERRMRVDFTVSPRESLSPEATKDAEVKTKLMKWIDDTNRAGFERSQAFDDAVKAGIGWMEVAVRGDASDIPMYVGSVSWRDLLHDSLGNPKRDLSDCRFVFRRKTVDLDIALAYFPDKEEEILKVRQEASSRSGYSSLLMSERGLMDIDDLSGGYEDSGNYGTYALGGADLSNPRERVMLLECWSMEPDWKAKNRKSSSTDDRVQMKMMCSIMTEFDTLLEGESPYNHNRFPFVPVWMYRNKETGLPYGPVKRLLDKQQALNDAMNKALYEMSVNRVIMEKDAYSPGIMDIKEIAAEIADPAGIVVLKPGGLAKFRTERGEQNARAQLEMAQIIRTSMQQTSSVTAENLGRHTAAESGVAISQKSDQGSLLTAELFDNVLLSHQLEGELKLSVAEQYLVQPMVVAVKGERRQRDAVEINKPQPDGTYLNDITKMKAQYVMGEQPWRATAAQAAFEQMMELMGQIAPVAPQVVLPMLDLIFEWADIPNKEQVLARLRTITGQPGPDGQMTPEQAAQKQQAATMAQAQFDSQLATLKAQAAEAAAKGVKLSVESVVKSLEGIYMAAQAAQVIGAAPLITPIADELLKSAGFIDQSGTNQPIDPAAIPAQPQPQLPAPQQAPQRPMPDPGAGPLVGHEQGIETPAADGNQQPPQEIAQ